MTPERRRLARLRRLERVRSVARDTAARDAAAAESTLAQLQALATRTRSLADAYRGAQPSDGFALRQIGQFVTGLDGIAAATDGNADQARVLADRKQADLAAAERSRSAAEARALDGERALARRLQTAAVGSRKAIGTPLE